MLCIGNLQVFKYQNMHPQVDFLESKFTQLEDFLLIFLILQTPNIVVSIDLVF